jgi:hypothetical protein
MPCTRQLRELRLSLWISNPRCEKCGVVTVLPSDLPYSVDKKGNKILKGVAPDNMATIQHKYDKLHPFRHVKTSERRLFLWCLKCNSEHWELYEKERAQIYGRLKSPKNE